MRWLFDFLDDSLGAFFRAFYRVVLARVFGAFGTVLALGFSLLPLSSLLLAYPALNPQESVLSDAVTRRGWLVGLGRRLLAVVTGLAVLLGLLAVSVEGVSQMQQAGLLPEKGSFAAVSKFFMPAPADLLLPPQEAQRKPILDKMPSDARQFWTTPLHAKMPPAMVEHWPFVVLGVYLLDVGVLLLIGKVPLSYNLRNIRVRWLTNAMTCVAFLFVVWLLVFLLAFVNGMNKLTDNSGIPGNVFVLSDGSTDEIFSNLGYGDLDNVERATADVDQVLDPAGKPALTDDGKEVWRRISPLRIQRGTFGGKEKFLAAKETYYSVNQPVPNTDPPRRRFVQLRTHEDAEVSAAVHQVELLPGGKWFSEVGVDQQSRIECVLGEGIATTLGGDAGKKRLTVGDTFELGEMTWVVTGVMKSEGKTFGSEIWAKRFDRIFKPLGKDKYTTLVLRTEANTREASKAFANYLNKKYTQQKLRAFSEPDYYAELTKTNNTFLTAIIIVCLVMAVGGVFGMMTTMFASIAQRIKDIGVLRLLGFKRWQVMVSFLLESLTVAAVGGTLGVVLAWLTVNGRSATSTLSGGGGGPGGKSVTLTIDVDPQVMAMGVLFALAMGRLGGLVPALSAMRMKILDSLR
jgi:putative ABC transport system permease protein